MVYILVILFLILVVLLTRESRKVDILLSVLENQVEGAKEIKRQPDHLCDAGLSHAVTNYHPECLTKCLREGYPLSTGHIYDLFQHKDHRIIYHLLEIMIEEDKDFPSALESARSLRSDIIPSEFVPYLRRRGCLE